MSKNIPKKIDKEDPLRKIEKIKIATSALVRKKDFNGAVNKILEGLNGLPNNAELYLCLGQIYEASKNWKSAIENYFLAIKINPQMVEPPKGLTRCLSVNHDFSLNKKILLECIELNPENFEFNLALGNFYAKQYEINKSISYFEKSFSLIPNSLVKDILKIEVFSSLMFGMNYTEDFSYDLYSKYSKEYGDISEIIFKPYDNWPWLNNLKNGDKIRVGFVSGDFKNHPVAFFLENVLKNFDKEKFELYAYSTISFEDETTKRLKQYFDQWLNFGGLSGENVAKKVREDKIHILIDLSGHTAGNALGLFAYKSAPIQVSWLGYFASTALKQMDYILVDKYGVKREEEKYFSEKVIYLPDTRLCFSEPQIEFNENNSIPFDKNSYITFGSYQNISKVTDEVLKAWSEILSKTINSRMRIQFPQIDLESQRKDFENRLISFGIDLSRIDLCPKSSREEYLKSYSEVDIVLDTFPYNGGTTTCEAMYMGVPIVTIEGNNIISRQTGGFLSLVGLIDWIAKDKEDYVKKAIGLSEDIISIREIRKSLRNKMKTSPIMDCEMFTRNFEDALLIMINKRLGNENE